MGKRTIGSANSSEVVGMERPSYMPADFGQSGTILEDVLDFTTYAMPLLVVQERKGDSL